MSKKYYFENKYKWKIYALKQREYKKQYKNDRKVILNYWKNKE